MSYTANEKYVSQTIAGKPRIVQRSVRPKTLAQGSGTLAILTPMAVNTSTEKWVPWLQAVLTEISTITPSGTVSGGNWTITVNGETTGNIAHNAVAATIQAALEALGGINPGDVVVTGGPLSATGPVVPVVLTWGGQWTGKSIAVSITVASLTGGGTAALVETVSGTDPTGVNVISGFLAEEATLAAGNEVLAQMLMDGDIHFDDIPIVSPNTSNGLKAALKDGNVRKLGFNIEGLAAFR